MTEAQRLLLTKIEGENFTHKSLWSVVERQIENAEARQAGSLFDLLPAMVFALLSFEAYLNFLGERLAPEIWKDERNFFRNVPYRGFEGKVRKVFELCRIPEMGRTERPYSTVWKLKDLRDLIVHGKSEKISMTLEHQDDASRSFHNVELYRLVSLENAYQARDDIYAVSLRLHGAAREAFDGSIPRRTDPWFGTDPFAGSRGFSVGHTTIAPAVIAT
jgi:hypothetical protein